MIRYLISLFLLIPIIASAEISFVELAQISASPEELEGEFRQVKYLQAVDAQLDSKGVFSYQRGKSIHWKLLEPIQNELVMTAAGLASRQADGELRRLDTGSNPAATMISQIFFSVLTADWNNLSEHFELSGEIEGQQWQAVLVPVDPVVLQVFSSIEISGGKFLKKIVLHESRGNRTTIHLENLQ